MAGAPRTSSLRIASATSSQEVHRRVRNSWGSARWSTTHSAPPSHHSGASLPTAEPRTLPWLGRAEIPRPSPLKTGQAPPVKGRPESLHRKQGAERRVLAEVLGGHHHVVRGKQENLVPDAVHVTVERVGHPAQEVHDPPPQLLLRP